MLRMGSSKPWPEAMEVLTGQRAMKADGLMEYFRPLLEWLTAENQRTGEYIGWETSNKRNSLSKVFKISSYGVLWIGLLLHFTLSGTYSLTVCIDDIIRDAGSQQQKKVRLDV